MIKGDRIYNQKLQTKPLHKDKLDNSAPFLVQCTASFFGGDLFVLYRSL